MIVRDHEIEHGHFFLDPCNLHPGQDFIVSARIRAVLEEARARNVALATDLVSRHKRQEAAILNWPD